MRHEKLKKKWGDLGTKLLVGRTIVSAHYMSEAECTNMGWDSSCLVIQLDDGTLIFPSQDDEGNGPGALFTTHSEHDTFGVI